MFGCPGPETTVVIRSDFMEEYFMFLQSKRAFGYAETPTPDQQFSDFLMYIGQGVNEIQARFLSSLMQDLSMFSRLTYRTTHLKVCSNHCKCAQPKFD